tara:strand:- start:8155 stop:9222 length:1068 start_codon:yes stop_codon:yes gene_type:complete
MLTPTTLRFKPPVARPPQRVGFRYKLSTPSEIYQTFSNYGFNSDAVKLAYKHFVNNALSAVTFRQISDAVFVSFMYQLNAIWSLRHFITDIQVYNYQDIPTDIVKRIYTGGTARLQLKMRGLLSTIEREEQNILVIQYNQKDYSASEKSELFVTMMGAGACLPYFAQLGQDRCGAQQEGKGITGTLILPSMTWFQTLLNTLYGTQATQLIPFVTSNVGLTMDELKAMHSINQHPQGIPMLDRFDVEVADSRKTDYLGFMLHEIYHAISLSLVPRIFKQLCFQAYNLLCNIQRVGKENDKFDYDDTSMLANISKKPQSVEQEKYAIEKLKGRLVDVLEYRYSATLDSNQIILFFYY